MMHAEDLGRRIKKARKAKGLTQDKLAELTGISTVFFGEIERGVKLPSLPVFVAMVEALDTSADDLLRDSLSSGKYYVNNEITEKLDKLTPEQRGAALAILDAYLASIK